MKIFFIFFILIQFSISLFSQRVPQSVTNNNTILSFSKNATAKTDHFKFVIKDSLGEEKEIWNEGLMDKILAIEGMQVDTNKCSILVLTWMDCQYLHFEKNTEGVWKLKIFALVRPFENIPPYQYDSDKLIDMETIELKLTNGQTETYVVSGSNLVKKK